MQFRNFIELALASAVGSLQHYWLKPTAFAI